MSFIKCCKGHGVDNLLVMSFIRRTITISRSILEDNYGEKICKCEEASEKIAVHPSESTMGKRSASRFSRTVARTHSLQGLETPAQTKRKRRPMDAALFL